MYLLQPYTFWLIIKNHYFEKDSSDSQWDSGIREG